MRTQSRHEKLLIWGPLGTCGNRCAFRLEWGRNLGLRFRGSPLYSVAVRIKRLFASVPVLCLGIALCSCGQFAGYVADQWPHWAGGEPPGMPPRPGTPGYEEFISHGGANKDAGATAATAAAAERAKAQTNAQVVPAGSRPPTDRDAVEGGLY